MAPGSIFVHVSQRGTEMGARELIVLPITIRRGTLRSASTPTTPLPSQRSATLFTSSKSRPSSYAVRSLPRSNQSSC